MKRTIGGRLLHQGRDDRYSTGSFKDSRLSSPDDSDESSG